MYSCFLLQKIFFHGVVFGVVTDVQSLYKVQILFKH